jgi:small neutral amino acid transporter SnatA (MarC family)
MVEVNEWWQMLAIFVFAANPAGAAAGLASLRPEIDLERDRLPIAGAALATALGLVVVAVAIASPLLDFLSVSQGTFRIAAGAVLLVVAVQSIWRGHPGLRQPGHGWRAGIYPLGMPLVAGPAILAAALNWSAEPDAGPWLTLATVVPAIALAVGAAVIAPAGYSAQLGAVARLSAVLLVIGAVGLAVSGVQAV